MFKVIKNCLLIIAKLGFAGLALWWVFQKVSVINLLDIIGNSNPVYLLLAFIASNLSLWVSGARSRYYFKTMGLKLANGFSISLYYVGSFFNILLPGGISGDGYRVYLLWKLEKFSKLKAIRIMFYERVNGFYILSVFGLVFFLFSSFKNVIPYSHVLAVVLLIIVTPTYLLGCKYIIHDKIKTALIAGFYSFWVQLFQMMIAVLIITAIYPNAELIDYINFMVLFIIATIIIIFPVSIGGIGIRELTFLYGLGYLGYDTKTDIGISFALLIFILNLLTVLPGLLLFYFIKHIKRK